MRFLLVKGVSNGRNGGNGGARPAVVRVPIKIGEIARPTIAGEATSSTAVRTVGKAVGKAMGKTGKKTARKGTPGAGGSGSGGHHFAVPKSRRAAGAVAAVSVSTAAAAVAEVMGGTATAKIAPLSSLSLAATIDGKSPTPNAVNGTAASTATSTDVDTCADTDVATAAAAAVDMKEEDPLRALYFKSGPAVFPATVVGAGAACCKVRLCNASSKVIKVRSEGTTHPAVLRCRLYALLGLLLLLLYRLYALGCMRCWGYF